MVELEPGRGIRKQRETGRVRFGKTVFTEPEDLLEDAIGVLLFAAVPEQSVFKLFLEWAEPALPFPGRHRAAQLVGFARSKARRNHCDFHDLFLEQRNAEGAFEHPLYLRAGIFDLLQAVLAAQVRMHHVALDGARPHDGNFDHQVVELLRLQSRKHRHLRARFDLEHADGVGLLDHRVDGGILGRDVLHPERGAAAVPDKVQSAPDRREHAQAEHVHFHQADSIQVVLVPFDDRPVGHCRVLDRHEARNLASSDHEATDVLGEVPRKAAQFADQFDELSYGQRARIETRLPKPCGK